MMEMRNYTSFVVSYLKDLLTHSPQGKPLNCEEFFAVFDVIYSPTSNLPSNIRQELLALGPALRVCIFLIPFKICVLLCAWGYGAVQCTFCNIRITF
jgi:hypothetical protein